MLCESIEAILSSHGLSRQPYVPSYSRLGVAGYRQTEQNQNGSLGTVGGATVKYSTGKGCPGCACRQQLRSLADQQENHGNARLRYGNCNRRACLPGSLLLIFHNGLATGPFPECTLTPHYLIAADSHIGP